MILSKLVPLPPLVEEEFVFIHFSNVSSVLRNECVRRSLRKNSKTVVEALIIDSDFEKIAKEFKDFVGKRKFEHENDPRWFTSPHLFGSQFVETELPLMVESKWTKSENGGQKILKKILNVSQLDGCFAPNQCAQNGESFCVCPVITCNEISRRRSIDLKLLSPSNQQFCSGSILRRSDRKRKAPVMKDFEMSSSSKRQIINNFSIDQSVIAVADPQEWSSVPCKGFEVRCILQPTLMMNKFNFVAKYRPLVSVKRLSDVNPSSEFDGLGVFYEGVSVSGGQMQKIPFPAGFPMFNYVGELIMGEEWENRENSSDSAVSSYFAQLSNCSVVDAYDVRISNWSRYLNRHCFPNLELHSWLINSTASLVFHSLVEISVGSQLTFHYPLRKGMSCKCDAGRFCRGFDTKKWPSAIV